MLATFKHRDGKLPPKTTTGSDYYNSGTGGGDFALYISPADVREKKREIGKKRVSGVSRGVLQGYDCNTVLLLCGHWPV